MQQLKLIELYFYVCQVYEEELKWHCERFTKNGQLPLFSDCELLTTYLFAVGYQQRFQVKQIHRYIKEHWLSWFPDLPSYQSYNSRLNRLVSVFPVLVERLSSQIAKKESFCSFISLTDSMPIMTCSSRRRAKVGLELCDKGYNAVKKRHFYGVKLHAIGFLNPGSIPVAEYLQLTAASQHDLSAQRHLLGQIQHRAIVGDKAFRDKKLDKAIKDNGSELITAMVYQDDVQRFHRQRTQAADDLHAKIVGSLRQPIEAFFNWLIEKTDIQRAPKVRSLKGLLVHVFGKIAAALITKVLIDDF